MSIELVGVAAAPGVAIAAPWVYRPAAGRAGEGAHLEEAARATASELGELSARLRGEGQSDEAAILDAQAMMATDEELIGLARAGIDDGVDPASAMRAAGETVAATFEAMDDELSRLYDEAEAAHGHGVHCEQAAFAESAEGRWL